MASMVKRVSLRELGLKRAPTGYGLFIQALKARHSDKERRYRFTFKQPLVWQHNRSGGIWRQLGPDGRAPYNAKSARLLAELRDRASKRIQKRQKDCDREAGFESDSLEAEGAGLAALASSQRDATRDGLAAALPAEGDTVASARGGSDGGLTAVEQGAGSEQAMTKELRRYREQASQLQTFAHKNITRARSAPERDAALERLAQMVQG